MGTAKYIVSLFAAFTGAVSLVNAQVADSTGSLEQVIINSTRVKSSFINIVPAQVLDRKTLRQLNAPTVGDAARFFSGVLVKDYGGAGGLKTISVRSLGASNTLILYDGLPVGDAQSGQVDLSRFSSNFLQSLALYQANQPGLLLPARSYAASSVLLMSTQSFRPQWQHKPFFQAGIRGGSFGFFQPFAGITFSGAKNLHIGVNTEWLSSKGNYPFLIENGSLSEKAKRSNAAAQAFTAEVNATKMFRDSSLLQFKMWSYDGKRGLPGAIVFFNDRSVQQLWNRDRFGQARYQTQINNSISLALAARYSADYTRYTDPDFPNNNGGLDSRYTQHEWFGTAALHILLSNRLSIGAASDIARADLSANTDNFSFPVRVSMWENVLIQYADSLWQLNSSLLWNNFSDRLKTAKPVSGHDKLTPTIAVIRKLGLQSPFLLRIFYKETFRMPTFNDMYYNFIGNSQLRPEFARQYNAGIVYTKSAGTIVRRVEWSVDAYLNKIKDKIIAVPGQNLFSWTMLNLGTVLIKGIDITGAVNGAITARLSWNARVSYTWQQAKDRTDRSSPKYGDRIPYTPDNSGSGLLSFQYINWNAGYSILFSGTRYMLGDNSPYTQVEGWGTHDIFISRHVPLRHMDLLVKAELNNLSNTRYDVVRYYPMPGRSVKFSILFNNL